MAAVWLRFRSELRSRWRAWSGMAVLIAFVSAIAMALAAGARRTDSAYERFLEKQSAYDALILNYPEDGTAVFDFDEIAGLPLVKDSARASFEYYTFEAGNLASVDGRIGSEINRFKILEGRRADPDEPSEIVVGFNLAEEEGVKVGDTVAMVPREFVELVESGAIEDPSGEATPEEIAQARVLLDAVPDGRLRVVGIEASPGEFPPQFQFNRPLVHLTPAFHRLVDDSEHEALMVRLVEGPAGVDRFVKELERRSGGLDPEVLVQRDHAAAVRRSIHFQAVALWLLAGLTALAGLMIVGQVLARLAHVEAVEYPRLAAIGMSRRDLSLLGLVRAAAIAGVGSVLGAVLAFCASPLLPTGLARTAEPAPGLDADIPVLLAGVGVSALAYLLVSAWPAWRAAVTTPVDAPSLTIRRSRIASRVGEGPLPIPVGVGVGMALERGRGRTAVPVLTALMSITLGITALVAALTFGSSLAHLLDTPRLYGVTWDLELVNFERNDELSTKGAAVLRRDERVESLAIGTVSFGPRIDVSGQHVDAIVLGSVKGNIAPAVLEGRPPSAADEIALGTRTLRSLGIDIGDVVDVRVPGVSDEAVPMRVVGKAVFPTVSEFAQLGQGALVTPAGASTFDPGDDPDGFGVVVGLAPGVDAEAVVGDLNEQLDEFASPYAGGKPGDIVNFGRVEATPYILGAVLAAISATALAYLLQTAVRRRRRDLAILKALGFVRRQVGTVVVVQATTVVVVGLVVGVPLGIALGRWVWSRLAEGLGVVSSPQTSLGMLVLVVLGAVVLANLVALVPARAARRASPATDLRSE